MSKIDQNWNPAVEVSKNVKPKKRRPCTPIKSSKVFIFWKKKVGQLLEVAVRNSFLDLSEICQNRASTVVIPIFREICPKNQLETMDLLKWSKTFYFLKKKSWPTSQSFYIEFVFGLAWNLAKIHANSTLSPGSAKPATNLIKGNVPPANLQKFSFFGKQKLPNFL